MNHRSDLPLLRDLLRSFSASAALRRAIGGRLPNQFRTPNGSDEFLQAVIVEVNRGSLSVGLSHGAYPILFVPDGLALSQNLQDILLASAPPRAILHIRGELGCPLKQSIVAFGRKKNTIRQVFRKPLILEAVTAPNRTPNMAEAPALWCYSQVPAPSRRSY